MVALSNPISFAIRISKQFLFRSSSIERPSQKKWVILGVFGYFGGTKNGTSGARIKILRSLFNTNTPLKPPFSYFGNNFKPRKSNFWPFYWFWSFSHCNSYWSRKILRTAEGRVVHQKQKLFWKSATKWNNLKPCRNKNSKFRQNKNHPTRCFFYHLQSSNLHWAPLIEINVADRCIDLQIERTCAASAALFTAAL